MDQKYSWFTGILPYLEASETYNRLEWKDIWSSGNLGLEAYWGSTTAQNAIGAFRSSTLVCPSSPIPMITTDQSNGGGVSAKGHLTASYAGVAGASDTSFGRPGADRCPEDNTSACFNGVLGKPDSAAFGGSRPVHTQGLKLSRITDGLSKVLAIGEQSSWGIDPSGNQNECRSGLRGGWAFGNWGNGLGNTTKVIYPIGTVACTDTYQRVSNNDSRIAFRSSHGGGAQFAFADGSVTWLNDSINMTVYKMLAIRDTSGGTTLKVMP